MGLDKEPVGEGTVGHDPVRVIRSSRADASQTPGMERQSAVDSMSAGSQKLWFGRVTCPPGLHSGPHHHGEAETAGYMLSGDRIRMYFGENYEEFADIVPGDFLFVPPYAPHIEVNMSETLAAEFIVARSPDNIVVNLDEKGDKPTEPKSRLRK
jgi:uncharacterized RmlC-like cupin family protein